jgi:8-oxo-dGTP pyrophosphatase MutT (NUDIX family)
VTTNDRENFVYVVHRNEAREMETYVVATFAKDGTTDSIQLTGKPWPGAWQFAGLTLGDTEDALNARLGEPIQTEPSEEAGTLVLAYRPWTFSFEIHDKKISSIRTAKGNT